jgi:multicomponent Na+:H+ antiporter subunit G
MIETQLLQGLILLTGSAFILIAGIGLVKLPDTLCRAHALSKAGTLGISLVLIALFGVIGTFAAGAKILAVICFNFITIPLSGHIFARYAIQKRIQKQKKIL